MCFTALPCLNSGKHRAGGIKTCMYIYENDVCVCVCLFVCVCVNGRVDATEDLPHYGMGRLLNHSKKDFNLVIDVLKDKYGIRHLCFRSCRDIKEGEELLIDYGERRKSIVAIHPFLNQ